MSWREAIKHIITSGKLMGGGALTVLTACYVSFTNKRRYPNMMETYSTGNILPPMCGENHEIVYVQRPKMEKVLHDMFKPKFSNEFYIVNGEVGSGKTRTIVKVVCQMMKEAKKTKGGAPVYVQVNQGNNVAEALSAAVNYNFDEHINYRFFLEFVMRINSIPEKSKDHRLVQVLNAIEKSAFLYVQVNFMRICVICFKRHTVS